MQVRTLHVTSDWLWYSPSKLVCISCGNSRRISFCIKVLISLIPCNPSNLVMVFMKDPCRACQSYWSNLKQLPKVTKKINSMKATQIRGMALTMESFSCNGYQQFVLTLKSPLTHKLTPKALKTTFNSSSLLYKKVHILSNFPLIVCIYKP